MPVRFPLRGDTKYAVGRLMRENHVLKQTLVGVATCGCNGYFHLAFRVVLTPIPRPLSGGMQCTVYTGGSLYRGAFRFS